MIDFILGLFDGGGGIYGIIAGAVAFVGAGLGLYLKGGSNAKKNAKIDDYERAHEIGDKADEARQNSDADKRTGDDRLRDHGKLRD